MTYLIGWTLVAVVAAGIALLLRRAGPPGGDTGKPAASWGSCCNAPPEVPPSPGVRRP